jgi:catechol 2,3-dioxygenase-like lactoylglutathione lyase family enzyme
MTIRSDSSAPDVVALRPFVPAKDFEASLRFYVDLGFTATPISDSLASMQLGPFGFLLQKFDVKGFAGNFMMHLLVHDVASWWKHIESLDLAGNYGVRAPQAPVLQPWGLTVAYVVDPSGVLWHIAQNPG